MKNIFLFLLACFSLASCGDIIQTIQINEDGTIEHQMTFDFKEPRIGGESTGFGFFNTDTLEGLDITKKSDLMFAILNPGLLPAVFDTTFALYESENLDSLEISSINKELLNGIIVNVSFDKPNKKGMISYHYTFNSIKEKNDLIEAIGGRIKEANKIGKIDKSAEFIFSGYEYSINKHLGELTLNSANIPPELLKMMGEGDGDDGEEMLEMMKMMFRGKSVIKVICPGKVLSVKGGEYEIINEKEVLIKREFTSLLKDRGEPLFHIEYEVTKPITNPAATEEWDPEPKQLLFSKKTNIPSDAEVLFDGKSTHKWKHRDGSPVNWKVKKGTLTVSPGAGDIVSKDKYGDCQLHLEWKSPNEPNKEGQSKGNSGVFFQEKYEVQILNSYQNKTYSNGQASSIYKQHIPLVNATKPSGEWNTYDIIFHAPKFDPEGRQLRKGTFTVIHNGILVQDNVEIKGTTEYIGRPKTIVHGDAPFIIQDHSNEVSFRNIWVRRL